MSPSNIVITGCNRGIGLELVRQYLKQATPPKNIIATYRDAAKSKELLDLAKAHPNLHAVVLDVSDISTHEKFAGDVSKLVGEDGLNLLINNAGILDREAEVSAKAMRETFEVNCVSPLFLSKALVPSLKTAAAKNASKPLGVGRATIVMMSSSVGSIAENTSGGMFAYRTSKAALNMVMKNLSIELKDLGILVMSMHPGWVKTDMGGAGALIDTETCCSTMLKTLEGLAEKDNGAFLRYDKTTVQW